MKELLKIAVGGTLAFIGMLLLAGDDEQSMDPNDDYDDDDYFDNYYD